MIQSAVTDGLVTNIELVHRGNLWINGGYVIFRREIFDYVQEGDELVVEPFTRLIAEKQLITYKNPGFWACMDTFKEKKIFDLTICMRRGDRHGLYGDPGNRDPP